MGRSISQSEDINYVSDDSAIFSRYVLQICFVYIINIDFIVE